MKKRIDNSSPVPLYFQLKNNLVEELKEYEINDKFPTENALCEKYGVSRITVRKSLEELVREGYIKRERGKGTIVKKIPKISQDFTMKLKSFNSEMSEKGYMPGTQVLELECIAADLELREALRLDEGDEVIKVVRVRSIDRDPLVYVETFFPKSLMPGYKKFDFANESFYGYLESIDSQVTNADRSFEAKIANEIEAKYLKIKKNDPIAYFETVAYSHGRAIEYSKASYTGRLNKFSLKLII